MLATTAVNANQTKPNLRTATYFFSSPWPCTQQATHQCKVSSRTGISKMQQLQTFDWPAMDDDDDDEAVAVAALPRSGGGLGVWLGALCICVWSLCLSGTLSCAAMATKCLSLAKLPNLFHLRWKYNCGYDGNEGGSVREFYCPFCLEFYYWKCFDGWSRNLLLTWCTLRICVSFYLFLFQFAILRGVPLHPWLTVGQELLYEEFSLWLAKKTECKRRKPLWRWNFVIISQSGLRAAANSDNGHRWGSKQRTSTVPLLIVLIVVPWRVHGQATQSNYTSTQKLLLFRIMLHAPMRSIDYQHLLQLIRFFKHTNNYSVK